jgi:hypothetical protein
MRAEFLTRIEPRTLRDLAAVMESRTPEVRARRSLSAEGVERLAEILAAGGRPTIGFWRRYREAAPCP